MAACRIYRCLSFKAKHLMQPYSHNFMATQLRKYADRRGYKIQHSRFPVAHAAFQGMDLSHEGAPTQAIVVKAIGPHHNPHSIHIEGPREAAQAIPIHGNAHLELCIHLRYIEFGEVNFNRTDWKWEHVQPRELKFHHSLKPTLPMPSRSW